MLPRNLCEKFTDPSIRMTVLECVVACEMLPHAEQAVGGFGGDLDAVVNALLR